MYGIISPSVSLSGLSFSFLLAGKGLCNLLLQSPRYLREFTLAQEQQRTVGKLVLTEQLHNINTTL